MFTRVHRSTLRQLYFNGKNGVPTLGALSFAQDRLSRVVASAIHINFVVITVGATHQSTQLQAIFLQMRQACLGSTSNSSASFR